MNVAITTKALKGQASLQEDKGNLRVRFPRELFGGKVKVMSLGLKATPEGYQEANRKLRAIQADINLGSFDPSLQKYQKQAKQQDYLKQVTELYPDVTITDLWDKYVSYKKQSLKESTLYYLQTTVTVLLNKCPIKNPYKALELREWLLANTTESMSKRVLVNFNAAFKWGIKHKLIKGLNPYDGMSQELRHGWEQETTAIAFTEDEKLKILEAFKNHNGNWNGRGYTGYKLSHYYPFVRFLFLTGCRPSEAVGLRWKNVSDDFRKVTFNGSIFCTSKGTFIESKGSKNNKKREFPCNLQLQELLKSIKPSDNVDGEMLIFPSPTNQPIHYNNFSKFVWKKLVNPIRENTTPYACRDTFITEQISKNIAPAVVAKWCDNSVAMIEKHYLDGNSLGAILPQ